MKKITLFCLLGSLIVILSVFAVIFIVKDASRLDPVEEAMKTLIYYTDEGHRLYLSDDGSYFSYGGFTDQDATEIVIPAYHNGIPITKIRNGSLNKNLKSVSIPDTVIEIDRISSFYDHEKYPLEFNKYNGGYYLGNENNPYHALIFFDQNYVGGVGVHDDTKVLAWGAFSDCEKLTSIYLPEGLVSIGALAFLRCKDLNRVIIPDSVTNIGEYTFSQCENLKSVTIGAGISEISERMFADCTSLTEVNIRGIIKQIGEDAFLGADSLVDFEIPETVTKIGEYAFNNPYNETNSIKNVTIHKGVDSIDINAFPNTVNCNEYRGGLYLGDSENPYLYLVGIKDAEATELVLHPDTYSVVEQIIPHAAALTSLSVEGGSGKYLYSDGNCIIRKKGNILLCGISTSVIPEKGVKRIAPYAFAYCQGLETVSIPDSVKVIGEYAFYGCDSISSLTLGKRVAEVGIYAFADCKKLESVALPDSLREIPEGCFYVCELLSEVVLSEKTEIIGSWAFSRCHSLKNISLTDVKLLNSCAFQNCTSLETVAFSEKLGYIGYSAFANCTILRDVVIPDSVRFIGGLAFSNCDAIKRLNIPLGIEYFGEQVYSKCNSLEYAVIPDCNDSLFPREFELCTSLKTIELPSTIKSIKGYAILGVCESLEEIIFGGTVEEWNAIEKSEAWCIATPAFKIKCTDGTIDHPGDNSDFVQGDW